MKPAKAAKKPVAHKAKSTTTKKAAPKAAAKKPAAKKPVAKASTKPAAKKTEAAKAPAKKAPAKKEPVKKAPAKKAAPAKKTTSSSRRDTAKKVNLNFSARCHNIEVSIAGCDRGVSRQQGEASRKEIACEEGCPSQDRSQRTEREGGWSLVKYNALRLTDEAHL